jgi:hypothetical protein
VVNVAKNKPDRTGREGWGWDDTDFHHALTACLGLGGASAFDCPEGKGLSSGRRLRIAELLSYRPLTETETETTDHSKLTTGDGH